MFSRVLYARSCAKVQAGARNGVDRSYEIDAPDCLPRRNRTGSIRRQTSEASGLVRINLWAVSLPLTFVKRNVRIYAYLCVVYEIFYEIPCAIEISKFCDNDKMLSLKLSGYK